MPSTIMPDAGRKPIGLALALILVVAVALGDARARDLLKDLDLSSPKMTEAEMTGEEANAALEETGQPLDLTGKRLNGLNLSDLDLSGVILRSAC